MKIVFTAFILLILPGCKLKEEKPVNAKTQIFDSTKKLTKANIDSAFENSIVDSVFNLKKIRDLNRYYDSLSNHKGEVSIMISKGPVSDTDFYVINVGYDAKDRFVSVYNFRAYKKNFIIEYDDPITGELIEINKWNRIK